MGQGGPARTMGPLGTAGSARVLRTAGLPAPVGPLGMMGHWEEQASGALRASGALSWAGGSPSVGGRATLTPPHPMPGQGHLRSRIPRGVLRPWRISMVLSPVPGLVQGPGGENTLLGSGQGVQAGGPWLCGCLAPR